MKKYSVFVFFILVIFLFVSLTFSQNTYDPENLKESINSAEQQMFEMSKDNFSIVRYNDTLILAKQLYENQMNKFNNNMSYDFSLVNDKLKELDNIKNKAYRAKDELGALKNSIEQVKNTNMSSAWDMYRQAKEEFNSERYEQTISIIQKTYDKISELQASETKLKAFYEATSRNIQTFLYDNWTKIVAGGLVVLIIGILAHNRIAIILRKRRIDYLKYRKKVIKNLISKSQKKYFEEGSIPEQTYRIRNDKYGELLRDINRQIPVLKEEISKRKDGFFSGDVTKKIKSKRKKLSRKIKKKEKTINNLKQIFSKK